MRKWMIIAGVLGAVLLVITLGVGATFAHGPYPPYSPGTYRGYPYGYSFTVIAEALGMTPEELASALAEGKSVAQIAQERGIDLAQVVDKLMEPFVSRMSWLVENGFLTQEQADRWLSLRRQTLEWKLSFSAPGFYGGWGCFGYGCPGFYYGWGGPGRGLYGGPRGCWGW